MIIVSITVNIAVLLRSIKNAIVFQVSDLTFYPQKRDKGQGPCVFIGDFYGFGLPRSWKLFCSRWEIGWIVTFIQRAS